MRSINNAGLIFIKDEINIEYAVAKIEYILNEDETFKYIFTPYYDVIDLLPASIFQGIPGLDLDIRKEKYERVNILPTFISERVPSKNRMDYFELLESVELDYMDPIEYLIRTKNKYSGDELYLRRFEERKSLTLEDESKKCNSFGLIKLILDNIAKGNELTLKDGTRLNSKDIFDSLKFIYSKTYKEKFAKQKEGIRIAQEKGTYKGRKPQKFDKLLFIEQSERVKKGYISVKEAARILGISTDKYYRIKKQLRN